MRARLSRARAHRRGLRLEVKVAVVVSAGAVKGNEWGEPFHFQFFFGGGRASFSSHLSLSLSHSTLTGI